jgi:hypothetical protein
LLDSPVRETPEAIVMPAPPPKPAPEPAADKSVWDFPEHEAPRRPAPPPAPVSRTPPPPVERTMSANSPSAPASTPPKQKPLARDSFLSAKDLAAAFKLNLQPGTDYDLSVQPGELGPILGASMPLEAPVPGRGGKIFAVLFFLGAIGLAVLFAVQPQWRQRASRIWNELTDQGPAKPPRPAVHAAPDDDLPNIDLTPTPGVMPATRPSELRVPPSIPAISDPRPVPATQPIPASPAQVEQAQILYQQAQEAESRHDFDHAARLFELIEKLPRNVWPIAGVDERAKQDHAQAQASKDK